MFASPAEVRLHFDLLLLLRNVLQLFDEHLVAVRENANLRQNKPPTIAQRDAADQGGRVTHEIDQEGAAVPPDEECWQ